MSVHASTPDVVFSLHAIERFQQRLRPTVSHEQAASELMHLARCGAFGRQPPEWCPWDYRSPRYLVVADVVFPLAALPDKPESYIATTCLIKHGHPRRRRLNLSQARTPRHAPQDRRRVE